MSLSDEIKAIKAGLLLNSHRIINQVAEEVKAKIDNDLEYRSKSANDESISASLNSEHLDDSEKIKVLKKEIENRLKNLRLEGLDRS